MKKKLTREQQDLAANNIRLAAHLAQVVWNRNRKAMEIEEVVAVAYLGLTIAAQRWNPEGRDIRPEDLESGKAFAGFARQHIMGKILDWQRSQDHVQRTYRTEYKLLAASGLDEGTKLEELSLRTGLTEDRIRKVIYAVSRPPVHLEIPSVSDDADYMSMDLPNKDTVDEQAGERAILLELAASVANLDELQAIVIVLKYYKNMYLNQIAEELAVPISEVSKAHESALLIILNNLQESVKV